MSEDWASRLVEDDSLDRYSIQVTVEERSIDETLENASFEHERARWFVTEVQDPAILPLPSRAPAGAGRTGSLAFVAFDWEQMAPLPSAISRLRSSGLHSAPQLSSAGWPPRRR